MSASAGAHMTAKYDSLVFFLVLLYVSVLFCGRFGVWFFCSRLLRCLLILGGIFFVFGNRGGRRVDLWGTYFGTSRSTQDGEANKMDATCMLPNADIAFCVCVCVCCCFLFVLLLLCVVVFACSFCFFVVVVCCVCCCCCVCFPNLVLYVFVCCFCVSIMCAVAYIVFVVCCCVRLLCVCLLCVCCVFLCMLCVLCMLPNA